MATIQGEAVKVELLMADGWQDITDCASEVEAESLGDDFEPPNGLVPEEVTFVVEDWTEYVKVGSGKYIAAVPRLG